MGDGGSGGSGARRIPPKPWNPGRLGKAEVLVAKGLYSLESEPLSPTKLCGFGAALEANEENSNVCQSRGNSRAVTSLERITSAGSFQHCPWLPLKLPKDSAVHGVFSLDWALMGKLPDKPFGRKNTTWTKYPLISFVAPK